MSVSDSPIPADVPPTIPAALNRAAELWPDAEAIVDADIRLSFAAMCGHAEQAARAFIAAGVQPGDRVAIWAPNSLAWVLASFGIYAAGAVQVPINTRFKAAEAAHVLNTSGARLLLTVTDFLGTDYVAALAEQDLPALEQIVVLSGPASGPAIGLNAFSDRGDSVPREHVAQRIAALTPDSMSDIVFTSGTTGKPKGAMLTHGASTLTYTNWADLVGLAEGDRYLIAYPFFHTAGLKSGVLACVLKGAVIVPHPVFDADSVLARVAEERITLLPGPPAIFQTLLSSQLTDYDTSLAAARRHGRCSSARRAGRAAAQRAEIRVRRHRLRPHRDHRHRNDVSARRRPSDHRHHLRAGNSR